MPVYLRSSLVAALHVLVLVAVASCGGFQQSGQPTGDPMQSPDWSEKVEKATEPAVQEVARASKCSGDTLNASLLARSSLCNIEGHSKPLPEEVKASLLDNSTTAISGQVADVQIVLRNTGEGPAELFLDHSCGFDNLITKTLRDAHNNRLDRVGRSDCPLDAACAGQVAHLTLSPGGQATITLALAASVSVIGEKCEELPGRALSPGKYTVEWKTPYSQQTFFTNLSVEKLIRLARSECKEYAQVVATKAEPDIKLRRTVEKQLLAQCQKEQPSQGFADCQMSANTEIELANCQEVTLQK